MIEFLEINKAFKSDFWSRSFMALDKVSFKLSEAEVVGFLGANGAGKTTGLKILMGFIRQTGGEIKFSKKLGIKRNDIFNKIGFVPERPYFYPYLTGRELAEYLGKLNGLSRKEISIGIEKWFARLQLDYAIDRKVRHYSKGMLQRLGFITALLHRPQIIILDEPLSGLDPLGRKEFKDIIRGLKKDGQTIFFSSHIVSDVEEVCEKVIMLEKGKVIYSGSVEKIIADHLPGTIEFRIKGDRIESFSDKIHHQNEDMTSYMIDEKDKKNFLNKIDHEKLDLIKMGHIKPTLEEIVYKIKK